MSCSEAVQQSLRYLKNHQQADGSFSGKVSESPFDFSSARHQPSSFYTSLVASCLDSITGADSIRAAAAGYIVGQRSTGWSWNYWQRGAPEAKKQPYPDDLDDTACALVALYQIRPAIITGSVLGHFAKQLIACETSAGGPYKTWLVDTQQLPEWHDVDIAVNANVGYFLSLQSAVPQGLEEYMTTAIQTDHLQSTYYYGTVPSWYFICRWYRGPAVSIVGRHIITALSGGQYAHYPLALASLLASGCRLGLADGLLRNAAKQLLKLQDGDHWRAEAFYGEPAEQGQPRYAGSDELTTAFAIEALSLLDRQSVTVKSAAPRPTSLRHAQTEIRHLPWPELRRQLHAGLRRLSAMDSDHQITTPASISAKAFAVMPKRAALSHLNVASLYGWLAYTIYDDVLDGQDRPSQLSAANVAGRYMVRHFTRAIPTPAFEEYLSTALERVDGANSWELAYTRVPVTDGQLRISHLPAYGNLDLLAARSWGHVVAPVGSLIAAGMQLDGPTVQGLEKFFQHYLIARQLNDDAHDWEEDLASGQLSSVVCQLLRDYGHTYRAIKLKLDASTMQALRLIFWQTTIVDVAKQIFDHSATAKQVLVGCDQPQLLTGWLDVLTGAAQKALDERAKTLQFIASFQS
jgi:hypothetical protein